MITCKICNKECKTLASLSTHIRGSHKDITYQNYYDKYFRKEESEDICNWCGKPTEYKNLKEGYKKFCSMSCSSKHTQTTRGKNNKVNYDKNIKKPNEGICKTCGNPTQYIDSTVGYREFCSRSCVSSNPDIQKQVKETYLNKTGYKNTMENPESLAKLKKTNIKKYGSEFYFGSNARKDKVDVQFKNRTKEEKKSLLDKRIATNLDKYGTKCVFGNEDVKKKIKTTLDNKTPEEKQLRNNKIRDAHNSKSKEEWKIIKDKMHNTKENASPEKKQEYHINLSAARLKENKQKIISKLPLGYELVEYKMKDGVSFRQFKCDADHVFDISKGLFNARFNNNHTICTTCNPPFTYNGLQNEVLEFVKELVPNEKIDYNTRKIISPLELDIYLPNLNLAIEFNGTYWHSTLQKTKEYHQNKNNLCENKNIQLIHVFEDQWMINKDIVKSTIRNILNKSIVIDSNDCELRKVSINDAKDFIIKNSLDRYIISKYQYGLYYNDSLYSIMTFNDDSLINYCTKLDYTIKDGYDSIFMDFLGTHSPSKISSYVNRGWNTKVGENGIHDSLGFILDEETKPDYFYIHDTSFIREYDYVDDVEDYYKMYDCGLFKYLWE